MRRALIALSLATAPLALLAACTPATEQAGEGGYDMAASRANVPDVEMMPDTSYLTEEERRVVNLLIEASGYMDQIYLRQRGAELPAMRTEIEASGDAEMLAMFDRNFGPWDAVDDNRPFYGETEWPEGAGFYPADLTREEFDAYLEAQPRPARGADEPLHGGQARRKRDEWLYRRALFARNTPNSSSPPPNCCAKRRRSPPTPASSASSPCAPTASFR